MTRLHFKNDTLKRVVQHSQKVKRKIPYEDKYTKKTIKQAITKLR